MKEQLRKGVSFLAALAMCLTTALSALPVRIQAEGTDPAKTELDLSFVCDEDNDLYRTALANYAGIDHYATVSEAVSKAKAGEGIAVLADGYPDTRTVLDLDEAGYKQLEDKNIRLYVEYPANNDKLGLAYGDPGDMGFDRAIVVDPEATGLENLSLLYVHGARYLKKAQDKNSWLVNAKVAGYDVAAFGLDDRNPYSLLEANGNVMAASTKLSQFISARYAPYARWQTLWSSVFTWLTASQTQVPEMTWEMAVQSAYSKDEALPATAYTDAIVNNADWYFNSGMLLSPTDNEGYFGRAVYGGIDYDLTPGGDGSYGVLENFASGSFLPDGSPRVRFIRRADCNGESAGALALAYAATGEARYGDAARNIMDWMLTQSDLSLGNRADPKSGEYGLLAWDDNTGSKYNYYGDDNAKAILGMISAAAALNETKWDERILECISANFRTTGVSGFRGNMISASQLQNGWEQFYLSDKVNYASHFEALPWATYLWAYDKTGYEPYLERTKNAIGMMMEAYDKGQWIWTNGIQQERAKMILPLAWLYRLEPTEEHSQWLDKMVTDLTAYQQEDCGGIQDRVGAGGGWAGGFSSNNEYGTHEAPVIHENGDPCVDNLYTESFALMTLNEASKATGGRYQDKADRLAEFLVRTQQKSDLYPQYDGCWFRGFDYEKWETYGSDGDTDWGIWSTETGWTQAWITNTLAMEQLGTCIWDMTADTTVKEYFPEVKKTMLTIDGLDKITFSPMLQTWGSGGYNSLRDGIYGSLTPDGTNRVFPNGTWSGLEGKDETITLDLETVRDVNEVSLGFLNEWRNGVRYPEYVEVSLSEDGETYTSYGRVDLNEEFKESDPAMRRITVSGDPVQAQYVRIFAKNGGALPASHSNAGKPSWIFMDELDVHFATMTVEDLKAILQKELDQASAIELSIYTSQSAGALREAISQARTILADDKTTADQVSAATEALQKAREDLVPYSSLVSQSQSFNNGNSPALLTDNIYGVTTTFGDASYGSLQDKKCDGAEFIFDLGSSQPITSVGFSALNHPQFGIYLPQAKFYAAESADGPWTELATIEAPDYKGVYSDYKTQMDQGNLDALPSEWLKEKATHVQLADPAGSGRYVKVVLTRANSKFEWIFLDEIFVNRSYGVQVNAPAYGDVTVDPATVLPGQGYEITLTPEEGSSLESLTVNGKDVTDQVENGIFAVSGVKTDQNVQARFTRPATDTTALQAALEASDALQEADWTAESWQALQTAAENARTVLADENATQAAIDRAAQTLQAAIEALEERPAPVDKTVLEQTLEQLKDLQEADWTVESWHALQTARETAEQILKDDLATQEETDQAVRDLQAAIDALEERTPVEPDKPYTTLLEKALLTFRDLDQTLYTEETWTPCAQAYAHGEIVLKDASADQQTVDEATAQLEAALAALERIPVDKTVLQEALKSVDTLDPAYWTEASWQRVKDAQTAADSVLQDPDALQEAVDQAADRLQAAIDALEARPETPEPADTKALEAAVDKAASLKEADYTPESWKQLTSALEAAQAILDQKAGSQEEVDQARTDLESAIEALQPAQPDTPDKPTDPKDPADPEDPTDPKDPEPVAHKIIRGHESVWTKGGSQGLVIASDAEYKNFVKVTVNGQDLDPEMYDVEEGSTVVTLKPAYLESLPTGKHTFVIHSSTGEAGTTFTVLEKASSGGSSATTGKPSAGTSTGKTSGTKASSSLTATFTGAAAMTGLLAAAALGMVSLRRRRK